MTGPWISVEPLNAEQFAHVRRRAIFDCYKWDPQVGDSCAIARHPLVLTRTAWAHVVRFAEALAQETLAAEAELVERPELHRSLGLPRAVRRALRSAPSIGVARGAARLMRFDFHFTTDGWRISEVNCDVPGGLNEASGFPALLVPYYSWARPVGDPGAEYIKVLAQSAGAHGAAVFVHATAYSDDQQMMSFIARGLETAGVATHLASPNHVRWHNGNAFLSSEWWQGPLDLIVRFFPAEWLCELPHASGWPHFFAGSRTPISNPATAILLQTKRFPLIWDALRHPLPAWRALLPETRDPREVPCLESDEWIVKPALGRVGEDIGMRDAVQPVEMKRIARNVRWWPSKWVAQRRFHPVPIEMSGQRVFPCLGIYTLDSRVIGAYGRLAALPLIDSRAADAAVLAA